MAVLQVKDLTKTYGKGNTTVTALGGVSFSVDINRFVGRYTCNHLFNISMASTRCLYANRSIFFT
jgi:hypothetical protein